LILGCVQPLGDAPASAPILHAACPGGATAASECAAWDAPIGGVTYEAGFARFAIGGFSLYAPAVTTGGTGGAGGSGGAGGGGGCGAVFQGDLWLLSDADIAAASGYCEITGSLHISTPISTAVSLPVLQRVGGLVTADAVGAPLKSLSFPALTYAKGFVVQPGAPELAAIDLGALVTLDGDFIVPEGMVPILSMPALTSVAGDLRLYFPIQAIDVPALETVGGLVAVADAQLSAPKLASIGLSLGVGSQTLAWLDLPLLTSIGQGLPPGAIALDLDPWVGSTPCFPENGNPLLASLHLPLLTSLGSGNDGLLNLGYCPLLPQCQIDAIALQLQQAGWTGHVQIANASACQTSSASCP